MGLGFVFVLCGFFFFFVGRGGGGGVYGWAQLLQMNMSWDVTKHFNGNLELRPGVAMTVATDQN